jgi:importin-9
VSSSPGSQFVQLGYLAIRWRPLEGAFAVLGCQSELILDISNEEHDAGRPRPIDIEYLLAQVIPSLLTLSGS